MRTTPQGWTVIDAEAGVLSLTYSDAGDSQANCMTAKLPSGGLMIISAPSRIDPAAIEATSAAGRAKPTATFRRGLRCHA